MTMLVEAVLMFGILLLGSYSMLMLAFTFKSIITGEWLRAVVSSMLCILSILGSLYLTQQLATNFGRAIIS